MAIYHCSAHNIARSSGRTTTASAAYRAAEKIKDERTGILHDYTRKQGVEHTERVRNRTVHLNCTHACT
ncbi:MobA/MobL family protein, partial [Kingella kingae]|uniref:MobA/MobL family protein n=1 Tax=Kingella kingae TaxID=504 RepID=UPI00254D1350